MWNDFKTVLVFGHRHWTYNILRLEVHPLTEDARKAADESYLSY